MKRIIVFFLCHFLCLQTFNSIAQSGLCDPTTPFYTVNLNGNPSGTWTSSPPTSRAGNCCGTNPPDRCIEFQITLDTGAVAINFQIASGAIPPGAMYYQISCGPPVQVGQPICVNGPGPHTLTFCKPGNNQNTYAITSIPGPSVSPSDTTTQGCSTTMNVNGLSTSTITWTSIYPGVQGAYNTYLSCTSGCATTYVSPLAGAPAYVDFLVCGVPLAGHCAPPSPFCDTIRVHFYPPINNQISPNPASFCANTAGIMLNGIIMGGIPPYEYNWTNAADGAGTPMGTSVNYFATAPGTYSLRVRDAKYPTCPERITNVTVTQNLVPIVNAGANRSVCASNVAVNLNGTIVNANGGSWSGGSGTFSPNNNSLTATYTPSAAEISAGTATLTLTSAANGACAPVSSSMTITIKPTLLASIAAPALACFGQNSTLTANVSGGTAPYTFLWSTGATSQSLSNRPPGTYSLTVTDATANLCTAIATFTITENPLLTVTVPSVVSCATTATLTASANGGNNTYNYLWSNGATTASINVLTGTYTVTVTDGAGCTATASATANAVPALLDVSLNQPGTRCFNATATLTATATGGHGTYTYAWSNGASTNTINVGAGSWCVTVTDFRGCSKSACVTITQTPLLTASIPAPAMICNGTSATVNATASGGQTPYTYLWSTGQSTASITRPAGTYTVTVTDAISCTATASVPITQENLLTVALSKADVNCFGGNTGSATASVSGGISPFQYQWSNGGQTAATATGLSAGSYTVTVTDHIGCTVTSTLSINQPVAPLNPIVQNISNVSCFGAGNGSISTTTTGGTAPYNYSWSPSGSNSANRTNLAPGTYNLTITDANGCTSSVTSNITEPTTLTSAISTSSNVNCFGGNNGTSIVSVSGGTTPYSYTWQGGQTTAAASGLAAGTFNVTVTDANACTATTSIIITQPPALTLSTSTIPALCFGNSNGSATANAGGGTPPFSYFWSNGQTSASASNLSAGSYSVTVRDALNCSISASNTANQPALLTTVISNTPVSCNGGSNGTANVSASGGTTPYTYVWASGQTTAVLNGLAAGTYTVTVRDANACSSSISTTIAQPTTLTLSSVMSNATCFGGNNGSIQVTASGATPAYSYLWSNGQTGANASALAAGNFTVTVRDANNCTATLSAAITQPTALVATISSSGNVSCFGGTNGAATVSVSGGTPGYSYLWSNSGGTGPSISGVAPGTYTVTVTDTNACTRRVSATITQPGLLQTSTSSISSICGIANGSANVNAAGGTTPYTYLWSNGANSATINGIMTGPYRVTVTDANGCSKTDSTIVNNVGIPVFITLSPSNVTCTGFANGTISLTASGGSQPYTFLWSTGSTSQSLINLSGGTYRVTVTNFNGCSDSAFATIQEPLPLTVSSSATNVSCFGGNSGRITATASGGTPVYSYLWSNGQTGATATGLTAGSYRVTVTDANNCTATRAASISQPTALSATISNSSDVSCFGGNNGSATVTASGGRTPYSYTWQGGQTTATATGFAAGTFLATVTDANSCTATVSVVFTQPAVRTLTITTTSTLCFGSSDGTATANSSGGTPPFTHLWSDGQTGVSASNLSAGIYSVTVTDALNCTISVSSTVNQPTILSAAISNTPVSCHSGSNGTAGVSASGGTPPFSYLWSGGQTSALVTGLTTGTFTVTVSDANACTSSISTIITHPSALVLSSVSSHVSCFGGNNGSIQVTASGGTAVYSYLWSNGQTDATATGLAAGDFSVTVTDANNCTATLNAATTQPATLSSTISYASDVSCFGGNNGTATITASGGLAPYTYIWQGGQTTATSTGFVAGTFGVTVTDANGCSTTTAVTIKQSPVSTLSITSTPTLCFGSSDGSATANAGGGSPPFSYLWSNGQTNAAASNLSAGTYSVTVTDALNCTISASNTINQPTILSTAISNTPVSCNNGSNGTASVSASGGTPPFSYLWSGGQTGAVTNALSAGTYIVTVSDANACTASISTIITQPSALILSSALSHITCFGGNNGSIIINASGGSPLYSYQWSPAVSAGASANNLIAGSYRITVSDASGCAETLIVELSQPDMLSSDMSHTNVSCNGGSDGSANVSVSGGTAPYLYNWSANSAITSSVSGLQAGTYMVTITDAKACTLTAGINITEPSPVLVTSTGHGDTICIGQNAIITVSASGGTGDFIYTWNQGIGTGSVKQVSPSTTTTYVATVTDRNGCTGTTQSVTVYVRLPLSLNLFIPADTICVGESAILTATSFGGNGNHTITWDNGVGTGAGPHTVSPGITTTYTATITDDCGTPAAQASITLVVITHPAIVITRIPSKGCVPQTISPILEITPAAPGTSYHWDFGDGSSSNLFDPTHEYTQTGSYPISLTISDYYGCTFSVNIADTLHVYPSAVADFGADPLSASIFTPEISFTNLSGNSNSWTWDFGDMNGSTLFETKHVYGDTGSYIVTLIADNQFGCPDTARKIVKIEPEFTFYIPNAFSPNGKGDNDYFSGYGTYITQFEMFIYDRWGNLIFESDDINKPWDGRVRGNGEIAQMDVYVYIITVHDTDHKPHKYKGHVTLVK